MRYKKTILLILFTLLSICSGAQERQYINYFYVEGDVCLPVRVKHSRGEFFVSYNGYRYDGPLSYVEAWDCEGRKIMDTTPKSGGGYHSDTSIPIEYVYVFRNLYPELSYDSRSNNGNKGDFGANFAKVVQARAKKPVDGYPNFQIQLGASRLYGEFARLKYCGGGEAGFAIYAGVGKDFLFKGKHDDKFLWHAALGYYFTLTEACDFTIAVSYAQTPQLDDKTMGVDGTFSYYFGHSTRFGLFIGGGAGVTSPFGYIFGDDPDDVEITWDVNVGIAVKLWNE